MLLVVVTDVAAGLLELLTIVPAAAAAPAVEEVYEDGPIVLLLLAELALALGVLLPDFSSRLSRSIRRASVEDVDIADLSRFIELVMPAPTGIAYGVEDTTFPLLVLL